MAKAKQQRPAIAVNKSTHIFDVYIGRGSIYGNPYKVGVDGTHEQCKEKYRIYLRQHPWLVLQATDLIGKRLGCFCKPKPCHGDIWADLANDAAANNDKWAAIQAWAQEEMGDRKMAKTAVVASARTNPEDYQAFEDFVIAQSEHNPSFGIGAILHPKRAEGMTVGQKFAKRTNTPLATYGINHKSGKDAGHRRYDDMVRDCDTLIALWDGKSQGIEYAIDKACQADREVYIIPAV